MEQDIKFRIWDKVDYMSTVCTLRESISKKIQFTKDCIIMQFTGLLDRNSKEIYEGDILEGHDKRKLTVFSVPGGFAIESNPIAFGYGYQDGQNCYESIGDKQTASYIQGNCTVIGNVYENSELLQTN